jgi:hypothetical protein
MKNSIWFCYPVSGMKGFYLTLVILLSCPPFTSSAAQTSKISRIGYLSNLSREYEYTRIESLKRGLRELGYIEGQKRHRRSLCEWKS